MDPGPSDREHGAIPLGSQELERRPLVLRGLRTAADGCATAAEDAAAYAAGRRSKASARAQGEGVADGAASLGRRRLPVIQAVREEEADVWREAHTGRRPARCATERF